MPGTVSSSTFHHYDQVRTMSKPFQKLPNEPTIPLKEFTANIPDSVLEDLKRRIQDTPEIRDTYETLGNAEKDGEDLGVKKDWIKEAISLWTGDFDWYVVGVNHIINRN
jgi:hypothetical protein